MSVIASQGGKEGKCFVVEWHWSLPVFSHWLVVVVPRAQLRTKQTEELDERIHGVDLAPLTLGGKSLKPAATTAVTADDTKVTFKRTGKWWRRPPSNGRTQPAKSDMSNVVADGIEHSTRSTSAGRHATPSSSDEAGQGAERALTAERRSFR